MNVPLGESKNAVVRFCIVLEAFVAAVLVYSFAAFATVVSFFWNFPYQLNFTEGATLHSILNVKNNLPLYPPLHESPFVITNYFPFYYSVMAHCMSMFSHPNMFFYGRALSFAAMIGIVCLVFLMLYRNSKRLVPSLIFSLLLVFLITFRTDVFLQQINLPAVLFSMAGFYFFQRCAEGGVSILFSVLFFFLAVWTKPTMVAGFSACWLFCIFRWRDVKEYSYIKVFMAFPLFVLLAVFLEQKLTRGNFFLHVISGNMHPLLFASFKFYFTHFIKETWMLLAAAVLYLAAGKNALYKIYFLTAVLFSFTVAKEGSGFVYFADLTLAMLLCAGSLYVEMSRRNALACLLILLSLALPSRRAFFYRQSYLMKAYSLYAHQKRKSDVLSDFIRAKKGRVLTEDADLSVLNGKVWEFDSPDMPLLETQKKWNPNAFLYSVQKKKYDCIIFYERFYSYRPFMKALAKSYRRLPLGESSGLQDIYIAVPR